jgi:hypothetical protein
VPQVAFQVFSSLSEQIRNLGKQKQETIEAMIYSNIQNLQSFSVKHMLAVFV